MKIFQKADGAAALGAAATYVFAMGLAATALSPIMGSKLSIQEYLDFLIANKMLIFIWNFTMYLINGLCLVVLVLGLYHRLKEFSPKLAELAAVFGILWAAFVFLSGLITISGNETLLALNRNQSTMIESLKQILDMLSLGIDSSDKFLGCLWIGLVSSAAIKAKLFSPAVNIFGLIISSAGLLGTLIPSFLFISYAFGIGAIIWWVAVGIFLIRNREIRL